MMKDIRTFFRNLTAGSCAFILLVLFVCTATERFPVLKGPYMGQRLPGDKPELFAPGLISTGMYERDVAIMDDGTEMAFGLISGSFVTIIVSRMENGRWTKPEVVPFASDPDYGHFEPHITPDGKRMLFLTTRPAEGQEPRPGWYHQNIWAVDRTKEGGWGEPYDLGPPINTNDHEYYPSVTEDGTLYFTRSVRGAGRTELLRSRWNGERYTEPEAVPAPVNGEGNIYNAFISPDESYLIACLTGRGSIASDGEVKYAVFFRTGTDIWSDAIDMGGEVNAPGAGATSATVSPDGTVLFFGSTRIRPAERLRPEGRYTLDFIQNIADEPENGSSDIYWINARFIETLRPEGF